MREYSIQYGRRKRGEHFCFCSLQRTLARVDGSMAAHIQLARGEVGRSSNLVYVNQPPSSLAELDRLYLRFSLSLFFALLVSSTDYY